MDIFSTSLLDLIMGRAYLLALLYVMFSCVFVTSKHVSIDKNWKVFSIDFLEKLLDLIIGRGGGG